MELSAEQRPVLSALCWKYEFSIQEVMKDMMNQSYAGRYSEYQNDEAAISAGSCGMPAYRLVQLDGVTYCEFWTQGRKPLRVKVKDVLATVHKMRSGPSEDAK